MDTLSSQITVIGPIDWIAMVAGILGVWLSIKEKVVAWPLFLICYSAYVYISFRSGYYAFGGMNGLFIGLSIYGWLKWCRAGASTDAPLAITRLPAAKRLGIGLLLVFGTVLIGWLLMKTGEARFPFLDAFATCSALCAQWMLGRKHIESWAFWIVSDCIYLGLFLQDRLWPSVILFTAFILLAIKGWREWHASIKT